MIEIRPISPDDGALVGQIHAETWKIAYKGIINDRYLDNLSASRWEEGVAQKIADGEWQGLGAVSDGILAGCTFYSGARDEKRAGWGEIISLYVLPRYWRRGIGFMLLNQAMDGLNAVGFDKCYLWVLSENRQAITFYKRYGFKQDGGELQYTLDGQKLNEISMIFE